MKRRLADLASLLVCAALEAHYRRNLRAIAAQRAEQCPDDGDGYALPFNVTDAIAEAHADVIREAILRELEAEADAQDDWAQWTAEIAHPSNGDRP